MVWLKTTDGSLTLCFGFCGQGLLGAIFHQTTEGTKADCTQAGCLIEGLSAEQLIADRGYDTNAVVEQAVKQGISFDGIWETLAAAYFRSPLGLWTVSKRMA